MTGVLEVVAEPHRRLILTLLLEGEKSAGEIGEALPLSQPGVSKHLKVLKDAGLVTVRQRARQRLYRLRPYPLREIDAWLAPFRDTWNERLDALGTHLDTMEEA